MFDQFWHLAFGGAAGGVPRGLRAGPCCNATLSVFYTAGTPQPEYRKISFLFRVHDQEGLVRPDLPRKDCVVAKRHNEVDLVRGSWQERSEEDQPYVPRSASSYIVNNVEEAIGFYCRHLDFREEMHPAATFAMLRRGDLRLLLSAPSEQGGGGQIMPDGSKPEPGGWNRISLEVADLNSVVEVVRAEGVCFRNDIVTGVGGRQILLESARTRPRYARVARSSGLTGRKKARSRN